MGQRLVGVSVLGAPEDIFHLQMDELNASAARGRRRRNSSTSPRGCRAAQRAARASPANRWWTRSTPTRTDR
jgi:hypothetical protein